MNNPWTAIPDTTPYVLDIDRPYIEAFNQTLKEGSDDPRWINWDVPPSPLHGFHDAPVVVLLANPFLSRGAVQSYADSAWRQVALDELRAEEGARFYALDAEWSDTEGGRWWRRCLGGLDREGCHYSRLAEQVLAIDFHGYFSQRATVLPVTLPSQFFGFELVQSAMDRKATIILVRAVRAWETAVRGLATYERRIEVRNPRSASISPANLGDKFQLVMSVLKDGA